MSHLARGLKRSLGIDGKAQAVAADTTTSDAPRWPKEAASRSQKVRTVASGCSRAMPRRNSAPRRRASAAVSVARGSTTTMSGFRLFIITRCHMIGCAMHGFAPMKMSASLSSKRNLASPL